jgi:hypothetical protein
MTDHKPMPVAGYTPQSQENIDLANELKHAEERYLRVLDKLNTLNMKRDAAGIGRDGEFDPRCMAEARTCIQTGAMWAVRAIFKPQRIALPEDVASASADIGPCIKPSVFEARSLGNTDASGTKKNVGDASFWGNGDAWRLLGKASSKAQGWMKSTKALEIPGVGCLVQVTTQQGENVAEALQFVPGVEIIDVAHEGVVIGRELAINVK